MVLKYSPWCKPKVNVVQSVMLHQVGRSQNARMPERCLQHRLPYARPCSSSLPPVLKTLTKTFNYKQSNALLSCTSLVTYPSYKPHQNERTEMQRQDNTPADDPPDGSSHPTENPDTPERSVAQHNLLCCAPVLSVELTYYPQGSHSLDCYQTADPWSRVLATSRLHFESLCATSNRFSRVSIYCRGMAEDVN